MIHFRPSRHGASALVNPVLDARLRQPHAKIGDPCPAQGLKIHLRVTVFRSNRGGTRPLKSPCERNSGGGATDIASIAKSRALGGPLTSLSCGTEWPSSQTGVSGITARSTAPSQRTTRAGGRRSWHEIWSVIGKPIEFSSRKVGRSSESGNTKTSQRRRTGWSGRYSAARRSIDHFDSKVLRSPARAHIPAMYPSGIGTASPIHLVSFALVVGFLGSGKKSYESG